MPPGKNIHLGNLLKTFSRGRDTVPNCKVVLFDDSMTNCEMACQVGYQAYYCPDGFDGPVWELFLSDNDW